MLDTATARVTELEGMLAAAPPQADDVDTKVSGHSWTTPTPM